MLFLGRRKTIDHCFLNCSRAKCVWTLISHLLSRVLGKQLTSTSSVVFFSFAGLQFPPRNLLLHATLSRPWFMAFGFFEIRLPFETSRRVIKLLFVLLLLIFLLVSVSIFFVYLLAFSIYDPFPRLFVLVMVFLMLISRCTLMSSFALLCTE